MKQSPQVTIVTRLITSQGNPTPLLYQQTMCNGRRIDAQSIDLDGIANPLEAAHQYHEKTCDWLIQRMRFEYETDTNGTTNSP